METNLGKQINKVRIDRGFTGEALSELCNINAVYLRQIEGGIKTPSMAVFTDICNVLQISPNYLLQGELVENEISKIKELELLWENATPSQQEIVIIMLQAVLKHFIKANS